MRQLSMKYLICLYRNIRYSMSVLQTKLRSSMSYQEIEKNNNKMDIYTVSSFVVAVIIAIIIIVALAKANSYIENGTSYRANK